MNVDRPPDSTDDPRPDAWDNASRSTDSPAPENPPPPNPENRLRPERAPEQEREPARDQRPDKEHDPAREHPPPSSPTETDSPANDTPGPAEPRSRQEHADYVSPADADQPSDDERGISAEGEAGDRDPTDAADAAPEGEVAQDDVGAQEKAKQDLGAADKSRPDDLPQREDETADKTEVSEALERTETGPPDQEGQLGEQANQPSSATQGEKVPRPTDPTSPVRDRTLPLTDKEWSEHVTEVRDALDKARAAGLESHLMYTLDPDHQAWSKDRRAAHDAIINDLYSAARNVPSQGIAVVAGGLGGAGKTTVLGNDAGIDPAKYLTINPDDIKEELARRDMIPEVDGLSPMEASDLVHEESSYLARQLALRAQHDGKNIIWDITMSTQESTEKRINDLREAGYSRIDGLYVDIPVETSIRRTEARHRLGQDQYRAGEGLGGRYLPPEVIQRQMDLEWGSKNRRTFESVKHKFNDWSIYDNSVEGRRAVLHESSSKREQNSRGASQ